MDVSVTKAEVEDWLAQHNIVSLSGYDSRGCGALHIACDQGNLRYVEWLLDNGAIVSEQTRDNDGLTPFMLAVRNNHLELAKWLVARYGTDPRLEQTIYNARSRKGSTPLMYAVESASLELVQWLVSIGADVQARNHRNSTVAMWSTSNPSVEIIKYIGSLDKAQLSLANSEGMTPFTFAIIEDRLDLFNYLRTVDTISISQRSAILGLTPILLAARRGQLRMVEELMKLGESLEQENDRGANVMLLSAQNGHVEVMKFAQRAAQISVFSSASNGCTAIMYAADGGQKEAMQWLMSEGCDVHERSPLGTTTAMFAAMGGHTDLIRWLHMDLGVNLELANKHGFTALHYAVDRGRMETLKYLLHDAHVPVTPNAHTLNTNIMIAAASGHIDVLAYLIAENVEDPLLVSKSGVSAFSLAASRNRVEVMEWLFVNVPGVALTEPKTSNRYFVPALHFATRTNSINAVKWLVRHGVSVNLLSYSVDDRALKIAAENGHTELFCWLLAHGANPTIRSRFGEAMFQNITKSSALPIRTFLLDTFGAPERFVLGHSDGDLSDASSLTDQFSSDDDGSDDGMDLDDNTDADSSDSASSSD